MSHYSSQRCFPSPACPAGRITRPIRSPSRAAGGARPGAGAGRAAAGDLAGGLGVDSLRAILRRWRAAGGLRRGRAGDGQRRRSGGLLRAALRGRDLAEILEQLTAQATQAAIWAAGSGGLIRAIGAGAALGLLRRALAAIWRRPRSGGREIWPEALRAIWRAAPIRAAYCGGRKRKDPARRPGLVGSVLRALAT
jgi:hypothetical protein